ncbi:MAG: fructose 1,6-bisphosphatase [Methanocorpusculum sp.]|nr:fructose 1,6-bisphosphatase [Methanocorpusculum sp.]
MHTRISVYTKSVGGIAGRARIYPDILQTVSKALRADGEIISDSFVTHVADRLVALVVENKDSAKIVRAAFEKAEKIAEEKGLFRNPSAESSFTLEFSELCGEQIVLFLSASEDEKFWERIFENSESSACGVSAFLCRADGEYPTVAELCEKFADKNLNENGICPVSLCETVFVRTKVVPVAALGFSVHNGKLTGPVDLFDTSLFESARIRASGI